MILPDFTIWYFFWVCCPKITMWVCKSSQFSLRDLLQAWLQAWLFPWRLPENADVSYVHLLLVGGFKHFLFSIICGIILPIDFHIFQGGWNHQPDWKVSSVGYTQRLWKSPHITRPGKRLRNELERSTMLLMGKSPFFYGKTMGKPWENHGKMVIYMERFRSTIFNG